jgi:hypothetical protein
VGRRWASLALVLLAMNPSKWDVRWTPHQDNVALSVLTECPTTKFRAYSRWDIEPEQSHAVVHRVAAPKASDCYTIGWIMRNSTDDPRFEKETIGEYVVLGQPSERRADASVY